MKQKRLLPSNLPTPVVRSEPVATFQVTKLSARRRSRRPLLFNGDKSQGFSASDVAGFTTRHSKLGTQKIRCRNALPADDE